MGRVRALLVVAALVGLTALSLPVSTAVQSGTVVGLAALVVRARRLDDGMARTRWWLLVALGAGLASGLAGLSQDLLTDGPLPYPGWADPIGLLYLPCTVMALVRLPLRQQREGFRVRAVSDGAVAATGMWFVLASWFPHLVDKGHAQVEPVALAYALGDVFVIAVALTTLARTVPAAQRMVGWLVAGLGALAVSDLWYAASATSAAPARRMLYEVGLLALAGAARGGGLERQQEDNDVRVHESSPVLSLLPLLPVVLAIGYAVELVLENKGLRAGQLLPGIALTCSLILREYAGSRDKERLLEQVAVRERGLRAELRRDALTGVANRRGLEEALAAALLAQDPPHLTLAVIDLDDFKLVNDNHGHAVGDQVIVQVARRIRATVRSGDVVARLGGDEFAVLLAADEPETGGSVHERLSAALRAPIQVGSQTFQLSSSTGIVTTQRGDDVARLLADADGAMYLAKARKAQRHAVVRLDAAGRRDAALRSRLREEIAAPRLEQFHLQYQPVVDLATGAIRGFEALLRWRHPDHGPVRPDVFIPLAEQCGSIVPLGDFVLRTALEDLRALTAVAPGRRLSVGVNVSPRQLVDASFPVRVCSLLEDAGLAADQLVLEITEQAFETDLAGISASASTLAAAGVSIGVDDFGTGYSSLRYLQHLDLEVLKVDRSFVSELGCSPRAQHLVDGITALARRLDLQIVAEGIETLDQLRFLQRGNCELGQGYLFSPAVPLADLTRLLRSGHVYEVGLGDAAPLLPGPRPHPESERAEPVGE